MKQILLISNASGVPTQLTTLQQFTDQLNKTAGQNKHAFCTVQDLIFAVDADQVSIRLKGQELHDLADMLVLRNVTKYPDFANALRLYADAFGIQLVNRTDATLPYYGKLSQGFLFALNGIATPPLVAAASNDTLARHISTAGTIQFPIILKHNEGIKGLHNYFVQDAAQATTILRDEKPGFVAQPYIENEGELRILRLGAAVSPLIFKKSAAEGSHLNNTSQGSDTEVQQLDDIDAAILKQAIRAAELTGRDMAGVDVLLGKDGSFTVLEVNDTPAIATGVFLEEKTKLYQQFTGAAQEEK